MADYYELDKPRGVLVDTVNDDTPAEEAGLAEGDILIALGGNALIQKGQRGTIEEQFDNLRLPMRQIASLSERYRLEEAYAYILAMGLVGLSIDLVFARITRLQIVESAGIGGADES